MKVFPKIKHSYKYILKLLLDEFMEVNFDLANKVSAYIWMYNYQTILIPNFYFYYRLVKSQIILNKSTI